MEPAGAVVESPTGIVSAFPNPTPALVETNISPHTPDQYGRFLEDLKSQPPISPDLYI